MSVTMPWVESVADVDLDVLATEIVVCTDKGELREELPVRKGEVCDLDEVMAKWDKVCTARSSARDLMLVLSGNPHTTRRVQTGAATTRGG